MKYSVAEPGLRIHGVAGPEPIAPHCRIAVADTAAAHTAVVDTAIGGIAAVDTVAGGSYIPVVAAAAVGYDGLGNSSRRGQTDRETTPHATARHTRHSLRSHSLREPAVSSVKAGPGN